MLARDHVARVELFNSSPVSLRVMARDKVWPYGSARTADIPNIAAALEITEEAADAILLRAQAIVGGTAAV